VFIMGNVMNAVELAPSLMVIEFTSILIKPGGL